MKPIDQEPGKEFQKLKEDFEYVYYKDTEGRLKRLRKRQYQPRSGFVRFKYIEKYWFWWKKKSFDYRNAILTLIFGMTYAYFLYVCSMAWSQNQLQRQIKARLPFEYTEDKITEMKRIRNQELREEGKVFSSLI